MPTFHLSIIDDVVTTSLEEVLFLELLSSRIIYYLVMTVIVIKWVGPFFVP